MWAETWHERLCCSGRDAPPMHGRYGSRGAPGFRRAAEPVHVYCPPGRACQETCRPVRALKATVGILVLGGESVPHLILEGAVDLRRAAEALPGEARRWRTAVLKTMGVWLSTDAEALLVEGVVVEHSRPLHPVAHVTVAGDQTKVRLWDIVPVERTPAVQRWLAEIGRDLQALGAGTLRTNNLAAGIIDDFDLDTVT